MTSDPYDPASPTRPLMPQQYSSPAASADPSWSGPQPPAAPQAARVRMWPYVAAAVVAVLFAGGGLWMFYDRVIRTDSGIAACEAMASNSQIVDGAKVSGDEQLTEAQYRKLRNVFEDSRYDDIRDHGTKLIDVVWQVSNLGKDPGLEALPYVGQLTEHMSGLQSACADQGIIIKTTTS